MIQKTDGIPAPRLPLEMPIEFRKSYARQPGKGVLKNISITGAFLETQFQELSPSDKLIITFSVSDRVRQMSATIIWTNQQGCGLQFHPFNKRDTQIVDDLMYFVQNRRDGRRLVLEDIFKKVS